MVRPIKTTTSRKRRVTNQKEFNAKGYAKRQSLKAQKSISGRGSSDVYEFKQEKERRGRVKLLLEKDERIGARGADSDEDEDEVPGWGSGRKGYARPRLIGEDDDDIQIGEDEDEEIDSDGAFDESDEDRFAGFSFASVKVRTPYVHQGQPSKLTSTFTISVYREEQI